MRPILFVVLMTLTASASRARAQNVAPALGDSVACRSCTVTITSTLPLDVAASGQRMRGAPGIVRIDRHGRYWLMGFGPPAVFDSGGRFIRSVGKRGTGVDEFVFPTDMQEVAGDSFVLVDPGAHRAVVLDSSLKWGRSIDAPYSIQRLLVLKWPDDVVIEGTVATPESAGWPLHQLSLRGDHAELIRSFGPDSGQMRVGGAGAIMQMLSSDDSGGFWSADFARYRLTHWNADAESNRTLIRRPTWFPNTTYPSIGGPARPPTPGLVGVSAERDGLLWVFLRVPATNWHQAWPPPKPGISEINLSDIRGDLLFRSVIEIIDPMKDEIVARRDMDDWIVQALPGRRAVVGYLDDAGRLGIRIVSFDLRGGPLKETGTMQSK